jgi:hypothetical protein
VTAGIPMSTRALASVPRISATSANTYPFKNPIVLESGGMTNCLL